MRHITAIITETDYVIDKTEHYIGVDSKKATKITLPQNPKDGRHIIVKAEMKPPLGNRKITIQTADESLIDGYKNYVIQVSHDVVHLMYRGNGWHVI